MTDPRIVGMESMGCESRLLSRRIALLLQGLARTREKEALLSLLSAWLPARLPAWQFAYTHASEAGVVNFKICAPHQSSRFTSIKV